MYCEMHCWTFREVVVEVVDVDVVDDREAGREITRTRENVLLTRR